MAAANLHAFNYGLRGENDPNLFRKIAAGVVVPEFVPKSGIKVQINENDPAQTDGSIDGQYSSAAAYPVTHDSNQRMI